MARDVRQLRVDASEASAAGKHKRALACYLELEQLESRDAQWSKRAAETYRRLGKDKEAVSAFARAADRYAQSGFLVQAIAVCKTMLAIDPKNDEALRRIAAVNEQIGAGPTRAAAMAESNPNLAHNAAVAALRARGGGQGGLHDAPQRPQERTPGQPSPISLPRTRTPQSVILPQGMRIATPPQGTQTVTPLGLANAGGAQSMFPDPEERSRTGSSPPPITMARTKSKPVTLPPNAPLETISLKDEVPASFEREEKSGIYVIPLDDGPIESVIGAEGSGALDLDSQGADDAPTRDSAPIIEIEDPDAQELDAEDIAELELEDIEEIPLGEPRLVGSAAADALARTPLFAGLSRDALEALVQQLTLVHLGAGEILFHEGDPGDALYVIVEGKVSVQAEGPPRVEMARLGAGAFIGEVALMTDQPRSATVTALDDAELLRIDRPTLSGVLATHGEVLSAVLRFVRDRLVDRWTRTSPLFRPFDEGMRQQIAARFRFLEIDAGSTLLSAGDKPDGLYIVLAGRFSVQRSGAQVAIVGPGELLGETALLSGAAFKSEVVAAVKSLALCLPATDFRDLIMTHPHVLEYIGEAAAHSRKLEIL
jgi:CRP-like cAMP-binding protein